MFVCILKAIEDKVSHLQPWSHIIHFIHLGHMYYAALGVSFMLSLNPAWPREYLAPLPILRRSATITCIVLKMLQWDISTILLNPLILRGMSGRNIGSVHGEIRCCVMLPKQSREAVYLNLRFQIICIANLEELYSRTDRNCREIIYLWLHFWSRFWQNGCPSWRPNTHWCWQG